MPQIKKPELNIFPIPQKSYPLDSDATIDAASIIAVPENPTDQDLFLAHFLSAEISDRYGLGIPTRRVSSLPSNCTYIVMGTAVNPLLQAICEREDSDACKTSARPEGYILHANSQGIIIAGNDEQGAFYGLQTLRQLMRKDERTASLHIDGIRIEDWPHLLFRGIRLYLPGQENISFFHRFIRDFMAFFKFNKLIVEVNASMRLDRHPELNAGSTEFAKDLIYSRSSEPINHRGEPQNSSHHDTADGGILEKSQIAELVRYAQLHHIEVIPEIPSLTHSFYLLTRHHEAAEIQDIKWPDTYCPSNPLSYELYFDVLDEYIEIMHPKMIHIGHDEWRMAVDVCERCRGKAYTDLFAQDVIKIHSYLRTKGIKVAMWGDHLMESVRNKAWRERTSYLGRKYRVPGALSEKQVMDLIPKDILIFNWFWADSDGWLVPQGYLGEHNDIKLQKLGFKQVYGNMEPNIQNWDVRSRRDSILGGAPSAWIATTELNFGKDLIAGFLRCANLLWSEHVQDDEQLNVVERRFLPKIRDRLRGKTAPSQDGNSVVPVDISAHYNVSRDASILDQHILTRLNRDGVIAGSFVFQFQHYNGLQAVVVGTAGKEGNLLPETVYNIPINQDASSLIFLHTCALPGQHINGYHEIHNPADTSELLGWYEVVYEDGFVETIPVRYGVNISHWQGHAIYGADIVNIAETDSQKAINFYAFEWQNSRFGRIIRAIHLKAVKGYRQCQEWYGVSDEISHSNAVILLAVSIVEKRRSSYDSGDSK